MECTRGRQFDTIATSRYDGPSAPSLDDTTETRMVPMSFRSWWVATLAFVGVCLTALMSLDQPALAQVGTTCTCSDVSDLINRLNMAEAARQALLDELPNIEAADKRNSPKPPALLDDRAPNGETNQELIRNAINDRMKRVQLASTSIGKTDGRCHAAVTFQTTACMNEIVMWHEQHVHVPACTAAPKDVSGFRASQTTVDYAKEEIAGYEAEIDRIKAVLRMLPPSCRPSGWVGYVEYREERTMEKDTRLPPGETRVSGVDRSTLSLIRDARVLYREVHAPTTLTALTASPRVKTVIHEENLSYNSVTGKRSCTGGAATPRYDGTSTGTVEEKVVVNAEADKDIDVSFDYDPHTGSYSLVFAIPEAEGIGTLTRTETTSGACNPADNGSKSSSSQFSTPYTGTQVNVSGTVTPQSTVDHIQGNDKIDLGPPVTLPDATITHSATVRWAFHKVP